MGFIVSLKYRSNNNASFLIWNTKLNCSLHSEQIGMKVALYAMFIPIKYPARGTSELNITAFLYRYFYVTETYIQKRYIPCWRSPLLF